MLVDFSQYDFSGLLNIQDSSQKLKDNELTSAVNVYGSTEGDLLLRRGVKQTGAPFFSVGLGARGLYRYAPKITAGAVTTLVQTIKQLNGTLYDADNGGLIGTINQLSPTGNAQSMSCEQMFDPSHKGGSDILVICTGDGGPYAYDGSSLYTLPSGPTIITGARWCKLINAVLFFGGFESEPNLIVASYVNQPENEPGYNTFSMSSSVVGLGVIGEGLQTTLAVGTVRGITLISGFTPDSFIVQEIVSLDGVQAGASMICVDGVLYFIGNYGIYRYDGQSFNEISRKVRPWIVGDPQFQSTYPMNGNRSMSWAMYWNRRIYFWYASNPALGSNLSKTIYTALVWDLTLQGWTIYQSSIAFGAACLLNATSDPDPEQLIIQDQVNGIHYLFDVYEDSSLNVTDNGATINSAWLSKYYKIGDPGTEKRLLRLYPEMFTYNTFNGYLQVVTDYGAATNIVEITTPSSTASLWGKAIWGINLWGPGSGVGAYSKYRNDVNIQGEAFAFGIVTPYVTGSTPLYRFMGLTGRYSQVPKN